MLQKTGQKLRNRHRKVIGRRTGSEELGAIPENVVEFDGIDYRPSVELVSYLLEFSRDPNGGYVPQVRLQPTFDEAVDELDPDESDYVISFAENVIGDISIIPEVHVMSSIIVDRLLKTSCIDDPATAVITLAAMQNEMLAILAAPSTTLNVESDGDGQVTFTLQIGEFTAQMTAQLLGNLALILGADDSEEEATGPTDAELSQIAETERRIASLHPDAIAS